MLVTEGFLDSFIYIEFSLIAKVLNENVNLIG